MFFIQVCRWVLKYKTSKNPLIQMTILNLLPRLAAFQPHTFTGGTSLCLNVIQDLIKPIFDTVTCSHAFLSIAVFTRFFGAYGQET